MRGLLISSAAGSLYRGASRKICRKYSLGAWTICIVVPMPGSVHYYHPRMHLHTKRLNLYTTLPKGLVALDISVLSYEACAIAATVPQVRASCAIHHICLYGTTMDGTTLCPCCSRANTTSLALHSVLGPQIGVKMAVSMVVMSLCAMSLSLTPNKAVVTIMIATTVAFQLNLPGIVRVFFTAFLPLVMCCFSTGQMH